MESRTDANQTPAVPETRTISTIWNPVYRQPDTIFGTGVTTTFAYYGNGQLWKRTETDDADPAKSRTWTYTYYGIEDGAAIVGKLKAVDGPRIDKSDITTYVYRDDNSPTGEYKIGDLHTITNAALHVTEYLDYDGAGRPLRIRDANDVETVLAYDQRGRIISNTRAGRSTQYLYTEVGDAYRIIRPSGEYVEYTYDEARRLVSVSDNVGNKVSYDLDEMGNRVVENVFDASGALKKSVTRLFDDLNQLEELIDGSGRHTLFTYDLESKQDTVTDHAANVTDYDYDPLNRLITVTDALLKELDYEYDQRDNLTKVIDQRGNETVYTYDGLDNLVQLTSPDTGITVYGHDEAGNRTSMTDARGVTVDYGYDELGRLDYVDYPTDGLDIDYNYDMGDYANGRLSSVVDESGTTTFVYDQHGQVRQKSHQDGAVLLVTTYDYDVDGRLETITYPSGKSVTKAFGPDGRVTGLTLTVDGQQFPLASNIASEPFGPVSSINFANGVNSSRAFDVDYRVTSINDSVGANTLRDVTYGFDLVGNVDLITDLLDPAKTQILGYDELQRLTSADVGSTNQDFVYDEVGNRTSMTTNAGTFLWDSSVNTIDPASNRILSRAERGLDWIHYYDQAGNLEKDIPEFYTGPKDTQSYDDRGRLVRHFLLSDEVILEEDYTYNAFGQRVRIEHTDNLPVSVMTRSMLDDFTRLDGTVVDDQSNGLWLGLNDAGGDAAISTDGKIQTVGYASIESSALVIDQSGGLEVESTIESGTLVVLNKTQSTSKTYGVEVQVSGTTLVVRSNQLGFQIGLFGNNTKKTFKDIASGVVDLVITISSGTSQVVATDSAGAVYDTGPMTNQNFAVGDQYSIQLTGAIDRVAASDTETMGATGGNYYLKHFFYDENGFLLGEYGAETDKEYVYLAGMPVAIIDGDVVYYVQTDHLGTPRLVTDSNAAEVWRWESSPFGVGYPEGTIEFNLRFPGQYFDDVSQRHYNLFRDYDPLSGRYVESDPIGISGGFNTYLYSYASPTMVFDRMGLAPGEDCCSGDPSGAAKCCSAAVSGGVFARSSFGGKAVAGTVICCGKKLVPCVNPEFPGIDHHVADAIRKCAGNHEKDHIDLGHPKECETCGVYPTSHKKTPGSNECETSKREVSCLRRSRRDCTISSCRRNISDRISEVEDYGNRRLPGCF